MKNMRRVAVLPVTLLIILRVWGHDYFLIVLGVPCNMSALILLNPISG